MAEEDVPQYQITVFNVPLGYVNATSAIHVLGVYECRRCGSVVLATGINTHDRWHLQMDRS